MVGNTLKALLAEANAVVNVVPASEAVHFVGNDDVVLVDIRETVERHRDGVIPGAIHAPRGFLEFIADSQGPMHDAAFASGKRLVLFCASGGRSTLAAKTLMDMGIPDVGHVAGGFAAWEKAGGPLERTSKAQSWQLRKGKAGDKSAVTSVLAAGYERYRERFSELVPTSERMERETEDFPTWVAEEGDRVVAAMVVHFRPHHVTILDLAVHPDAQGQGIGRALLDAAEAEARRTGVAELRSITHKFHHEAHEFFQRHGWSAVTSGNPVSTLFEMSKPVSGP